MASICKLILEAERFISVAFRRLIGGALLSVCALSSGCHAPACSQSHDTHRSSEPATRFAAEGARVSVMYVSDADPTVLDIVDPGVAVVAIAGDGKGGMRTILGRNITEENLTLLLQDAAEVSKGEEIRLRIVVYLVENNLTMSDLALALNKVTAIFRHAFPRTHSLRIFIPSDIFRPGWPGE